MSSLNVGIVGGGIAGLYTALLLQREGHRVRVFEGTDRIGGRVHTHYFSQEKDQYYEAGAMRIPNSDFHRIVFQLIDHLNGRAPPGKDMALQLIPYILNAPGNDVYINGARPAVQASSATPTSVGWENVPEQYRNKSTKELLELAVGPFIKLLQPDFEKGFKYIVDNFDQYSFRYYCEYELKWPPQVIDFVETLASQTNQFNLSIPELVMQTMDFYVEDWKTIDRGMSRLPQLMAHLVDYKNITFGARVTGLEVDPADGRVTIAASGYNGSLSAKFDRVVLAVPPAAMRMITHRPRWSVTKEMAIRAMHFESLYKMGLRFKTRFWERVAPNPSKGGQSTSDLPIRWVVFPSNGIGEDGPGVLLVYAWMTDANNWPPLTPFERRKLALDCIQELYANKKDGGKPIDVQDLLIETSDAVWSASTATGDAMFLPGQFRAHFDVARKREGNIFFAGEHLSYHHTWISGAANSALDVVRDMLSKPNLPPLDKPTQGHPATAGGQGVAQEAVGERKDTAPGAFEIASGIIANSAAKVPFEFRQHGHSLGEQPPDSYDIFPTNLGMSGDVLGAAITSLKAHNAVGP